MAFGRRVAEEQELKAKRLQASKSKQISKQPTNIQTDDYPEELKMEVTNSTNFEPQEVTEPYEEEKEISKYDEYKKKKAVLFKPLTPQEIEKHKKKTKDEKIREQIEELKKKHQLKRDNLNVIPEENEEKWGTGKYGEDMTVRNDIDQMEGYQGPQYDDEFARASKLESQEISPGHN